MSILTFKGGIHPKDGKAMSKAKAIKTLTPKGEIVIPLSQHIGAPATPCVEVGDRVLVGQKIGEASGFISANVHSSVAGTVKKIEPRMIASGAMVNCVVIENDDSYEEYIWELKDYEDMSKDDIRAAIKEAGIVGMGGAGFPTHVKLTPKDDDAIEYVIVNGAECEPYLTSDYRRMIEEPQVLIDGLKIVLSLFKNAKGIIAIEDNKLDAITELKKLTKNEDNIQIKGVYTKYPQGGERALIYAVTGREVNSSMLPADVGCVVNNVDTIFAIHNAVINHKSLYTRVVTVTGDAVTTPGNYLVPIGTSFNEVIQAAEGFKRTPEKIIAGGPMMGVSVFTTDIPITKGSSAILAFRKDQVAASKPSPCINCGKCLEVCPGRVMPSRLATMAEHGDVDGFIDNYGMECCECGCCSYICPAKRNLTQSIKSMRKDILASRKK
ncbi:MAG: electron transport complex subunit RsxC [Lachnospiraceae bacterium]|nr:electron transport complex subunit RsxC [Lachnospiraceae bacterium]